jgi:hypothetical protein
MTTTICQRREYVETANGNKSMCAYFFGPWPLHQFRI